jgi:hypothetical protein
MVKAASPRSKLDSASPTSRNPLSPKPIFLRLQRCAGRRYSGPESRRRHRDTETKDSNRGHSCGVRTAEVGVAHARVKPLKYRERRTANSATTRSAPPNNTAPAECGPRQAARATLDRRSAANSCSTFAISLMLVPSRSRSGWRTEPPSKPRRFMAAIVKRSVSLERRDGDVEQATQSRVTFRNILHDCCPLNVEMFWSSARDAQDRTVD